MTIIDALAGASGRTRVTIDAGSHGERVTVTAGELLELGLRAAARLTAAGVLPGERVTIAHPTSVALLASTIGCWCAGAVPVILPIIASKSEGPSALLQNIVNTVGPRLVIGTGQPGEAIAEVNLGEAAILAGGDLIAPGPQSDLSRCPVDGDISLLQLSSGSTGNPRACVIRHGQMIENLRAVMERTRSNHSGDDEDRGLVWLPFNHDMGFNSFFCSLLAGVDITLIPTESFSRSPYVWLQRMSETRATLSPAPTFAYRLLTQINHARQLRDIDLSAWRYGWMGAEPIYPDHVAGFAAAFAGRGLRPTAIRPSYGLAESVLATTMLPSGEAVSMLAVDQETLIRHGEIRVVREPVNGLALVGCGYPLTGLQAMIGDGDGKDLGEDRQGRILLRGNCVIDSYWGEPPRPRHDGYLDTGDIGFLHNRQLYISGRAKDIIISGGKNYAANDIERVLEAKATEAVRRAAVFSVLFGNRKKEEIVAIIETKSRSDEAASLEKSLREHVSIDMGLSIDRVIAVPLGTIPRTSSGKIQRGAIRDIYLAGGLDRLSA